VDSRRSIWQVVGVLGGALPSAVPDVYTEGSGRLAMHDIQGFASTREAASVPSGLCVQRSIARAHVLAAKSRV
jgi:hypothetical protein